MVRRKDKTEAFAELAGTILAALDRAGIGMTITSQVDDRVERLYLNDSGARILGYDPCGDPDEIPPLLSLAPEEQARMRELSRRFLRGEDSPETVDTLVLHPDGTRVPIEVGLATSEYRDRRATVAFFRDISARRRVEEQLRTSESRFRQFVEAAPDAITVISNGHFVYANPAALKVLAFDTLEEFCARPLSELLLPDELALMERRTVRVFAGERLPPYEYRGRRNDGTWITIEISSIAIDWDGRPALLAYGRPVEERKRMQAELLQADRMATVGTLAAGVAHEINNPLTYLLLNLHRLRSRLPDLIGDDAACAKVLELLAEALDGGERVRVIVKDLLAFARADDNERKPVNARAVLESSIKLAQNALRHRATVERQFEDVPPVLANEPRLGQVFLNLLVNAAQAFDDDSVERNHVRVSLRSAEYGFVAVEIEDNGCGIPEAELPHVFDPFFTTKPVGAGTGLGLAITRSIIDSFDGQIFLDSEPGRGTRVRVLLQESRSARAGSEEGLPSLSGRRARILLIDDEIALASSLAEELADYHDVEVRTSSTEALALLEADAGFDLVLCDLIMPELTGMELYARVCEQRPDYAGRFVFITGGAFTPRAAAFVATTKAAVLSKPFDPRTLQQVIARRLSSAE